VAADYVIDVCSMVDTFCSTCGIASAYLKIDVEGHESAVLSGAMRTLRGVSAVVVECHSEELRAEREDLSRLRSCRILYFRIATWTTAMTPRPRQSRLSTESTSASVRITRDAPLARRGTRLPTPHMSGFNSPPCLGRGPVAYSTSRD
jgi:hypothetical protein